MLQEIFARNRFGGEEVSNMRFLVMALSITVAVQPNSAFAQSRAGPLAEDGDAGGNRVTLALGVVTLPSYEGSDDQLVIPAPAAFGEIGGYSFSTRGASLYVDVIRNAPGDTIDVQFGPVVGINLSRAGEIKDERVEALGKVRTAVEVGGYVGLAKTGVITSAYDSLNVSVAFIHDVSDVHSSYVLTPELSYVTPLNSKALLLLSASASYAGKGYAQTYFGVDSPGALRSQLPVFQARPGWKNLSLSALGTYSLTGDLRSGLALVLGVSYGRLLNDFAESPVVSIAGSRDQWIGGAGLAYTF